MEDRLRPLALRASDNRRFPAVSTAYRHRMSGCQLAGATPIMAHGRGASVPTPVAKEITGWRLSLIGSTGSRPNPFASSLICSLSAEGARHIERHLLAQHVIAGPRQFMRHGLQGHQRMRPRLFALIEIPDHGLIANGEVGRFNEGPA